MMSGIVSTVGPGVEAVTVDVEATDPPARMKTSFHHGDRTPPAGEVQCGRQAGQPGADHDHAIGVARDRAHQAALSRARHGHIRERGPHHRTELSGVDPVQRTGESRIDLLLNPIHRAGGGYQCAPAPQVVLVQILGAHQLAELTACVDIREMMRGDHNARGFVLGQIGTGGLAGDRRVAEDAQHVVAQLKRLADRRTVPAKQRDRARVAAGKDGADLQRPAHRVVARFAA